MILGVALLVAGLVPIAVAGVRFWRNADADDWESARDVMTTAGLLIAAMLVIAGIVVIWGPS